MAYLRPCLLLMFSFVARAVQNDPIADFCRRWGHQTAQIDGRLFIDGGMVDWDPTGLNYTNTWLLFSDLNSSHQVSQMPAQYSNLTKPAHIPSVSGGTLWADDVNKCFYQFGGEYPPGSSPTEASMWTYDVLLDQWNNTEYTSDSRYVERVSFGAGTEIGSVGLGYYYGGWLNERTTPGWARPPMATSNLIQFEFSTGIMKNESGPDAIGRAEGQLVYLPASDSGLLIYFGGVEDPYRNGTIVAANMTDIHIFNVGTSRWYKQTATGDTPLARRQFCADVTWADDQSSYNIYIYGGYGFGDPLAFDDVYILSLPSFTWIQSYPQETNGTTRNGHGGCSANVINRNQMLVVGGWFPEFDQCDSANGQGQHNMNLGYNGPDKTIWDEYYPTLTEYSVPTPILSAIGGGPTGGATVTAPATWNDKDLSVYFTRKASFTSRAATRLIPTNTAGSPPDSNKTNIGAIAGGVVGGLAVLIGILCLILFCLHRRKQARKKDQPTSTAPRYVQPAELAATISRRELPSPGETSQASQPASHNHNHDSPHSFRSVQPYMSTSPASARSYPAEAVQQEYQQHNMYQPHADNRISRDNPSSWDQPTYPPPPAAGLQNQHLYAAPTSPTTPSSYQAQQQAQIYYPPPPEPAMDSHGQHTSVDYSSGLDARRYSSDVSRGALSTTSTPAQFYAQPVPDRHTAMDENLQHSPRFYMGDEDVVRSGENALLGNPVSERVGPARRRLVENGHV